MKLKLKELQNVAKTTMKEERAVNSLREEIVNLLGPSVNVLGNHNYFASFVNDHLDVLESTGRFPRQGAVKTTTLIEASGSKFEEIRKVAARLLPEKFITKFLNDSNSSVRCAAAKRLPYSMIRESVRFYTDDDQLRSIVRMKRIHEAGLPAPKVVDEPFDMNGDPLGDSVKTHSLDDLPDSWYERLANKLCKEYGSNLEGQWEEILATRVATSNFATSSSNIDRDKLLKALYSCIKEREDLVLGEGSLKSIVRGLRKKEYLDEAVMPIIEESIDPVKELLEASLSSSAYVERAEKLFSVKKSYIPAGIKKYRLGEGYNADTEVPMLGRLPNGSSITSTTEKALDVYVDSWNKQQTIKGEPYRLSWNPHPSSISMVGFNLELK